jgi:uncharacterized protein (TIGR02453 family)
LTFLRALKRHNDREWFRGRRADYDALVRQPLIDVIERLAVDFQSFAPDLVASATMSPYRIYRDTRFSEDKTPLKTQAAAVFPHRRLGKHQGAGLYFEVGPDGVWMGGGMYAPDASQLHRVRTHIASHLRQFRAIVESPAFRRRVGPLEGSQLTRVPRGFAATDPAAPYLKYRQFLAGRELPARFAHAPRFYSGLLDTFRLVAPLVMFLNEPLIGD